MGECRFCGRELDGGIWSRLNDDGYGTLKKLGVIRAEQEEWGGTCWDCADRLEPHREAVEQQKRAHFAARSLCGFLEAWIGHCLEPKPCAKHAAQLCWRCKAAAVSNCAHTGALVCGVPECAEHPHMDEAAAHAKVDALLYGLLTGNEAANAEG